jgi:hypothetical protein
MTEDKVAGQVGISRERLREIRANSLSIGIHFEKNGAAIIYTEAGIDAVLATISTSIQNTLDSLDKKTPPPIPASGAHLPGHPVLETLRIVKTCPNPTWVKARTPVGKIVQCRVRHNRSMRMGTILDKCELQPDGTYVCRGRF